jgi:glycerol-3-phosphate cytidylyltransferase-like family protein
VDEVIPDAPWMLEKDQLVQWRINYVAFDEGTSVDPAFDKTRLKAYDALKSMGTSTSNICPDRCRLFAHSFRKAK